MSGTGNNAPEFLNSLPIRHINIGGTLRAVRYDDENKRIYLLDSEGNYTGHTGSADLTGNQKPMPQEQEKPNIVEPAPEQVEQEKQDPTQEQELPPPELPKAEEQESEDETEEDHPKSSGKTLLIVFGCTAVFIAIIVLLAKLFSGPSEHTQTPNETDPPITTTAAQVTEGTLPEDTTSPTEQTEAPTVPEVKVPVLVAAAPLLPGDKLASSGIVVQEVTEAEYTALTAMGGVYVQGEETLLDGFVTTQYIPMGGYLWRSCAGISYTPANPWSMIDNGYETAQIPVTVQPNQLEGILCGTQVDIKIEIQTKLTTDNPVLPDTDGLDASGLQHDSSTVESMVIDTYIVPNALVVDMLNKQTASLHSAYASLATMPAPYRSSYLLDKYASTAELESMIPAYILISVPQQQAEFLSTLNTGNMTVKITESTPNIQTSLQADSYAAVKEAAGSVSDVWNRLLAAEGGE